MNTAINKLAQVVIYYSISIVMLTCCLSAQALDGVVFNSGDTLSASKLNALAEQMNFGLILDLDAKDYVTTNSNDPWIDKVRQIPFELSGVTYDSKGFFNLANTNTGIISGAMSLPGEGYAIELAMSAADYSVNGCFLYHLIGAVRIPAEQALGRTLHLCLRRGGPIEMDEWARSAISNEVLVNGSKHHFLFVHEYDSSYSIYIDGVLDINISPPGAGPYNARFVVVPTTGTEPIPADLIVNDLSGTVVAKDGDGIELPVDSLLMPTNGKKGNLVISWFGTGTDLSLYLIRAYHKPLSPAAARLRFNNFIQTHPDFIQ